MWFRRGVVVLNSPEFSRLDGFPKSGDFGYVW
jgi:hypothetical protein